jgi:hypothetical protein
MKIMRSRTASTVVFWAFLAAMLALAGYLIVAALHQPDILMRCVTGCDR